MLIARYYRLYPSDGTREMLVQHFGCARFVYNEALAYNQEHYSKTGKFLSAFDLMKRLPGLKEQYPWLKDVNAQALQQVLTDLGAAFNNFYKKRGKFPHFKSKRHSRQSCRFPQTVLIDEEYDTIKLPKIGKIDAIIHRPLSGELKSITISKNAAQQYHAACLVEDALVQPRSSFIGKTVGVDLGSP